MKHPGFFKGFIFILFSFYFGSLSQAQTLTSATIVGVISDASGTTVANASVKITQADNGAVRTAVSNSSGEYRFPFLKPGDYTVTAEASGLSSAAVKVQLLVGKEQDVNIRLAVDSIQQTAEVTTASTLLQTENGNQTTSYSQQYIENTPVNGGDVTNIAFSTPGIRLNVGGGNTNFNVNGLPFSSVLFTVNGADIVEPYNLNNKSGSSNNTLGANDIAEAAVVVSAYSAQYGREAGAQVNYVTKSGTNKYHGNLVENYNGEGLNANDSFNKLTDTPRARAVANQYGASIGGPILHDKLTFFANTEGLRYVLPTNGVVSLPSPQLQSYILSHVPAASAPVYQSLFAVDNAAPGVGRAVAVTNGSLPLQDTTGHLGCGTQSFTGTATGTGGVFGVDTPCAVAFGTTAKGADTEYYISGRVDYNINDKQKVYVRVSFDDGNQPSTVSTISPIFNKQSQQPWVIPQINYTYAITPRLVNNFILNGNWYSVITGSPNFAAAQKLLPASFTFSDGGANGGGFAAIAEALPTGRRGQQLGVIDDLSYSLGKHTLQVGINDRNNRITDSSIASGSVAGTYTFTDLTDFAAGVLNQSETLSTYTQSYPLLQAVHTRLNSLDFYGQDEWKVRKNLNVTYGLRFEYQGNPSCKENCFSRVNTAFLGSGYQAGASVPYNQTLETGLHKTFANFEGIITEPRVSAAWQPFGESKTVVRGGIGWFANTIPGNLTANVFGNAPNKFSPLVKTGFVGGSDIPGSAQNSALSSSQAFTAGFTSGDTLSQLQTAVAPATFSTPSLYVNPNTYHTIRVLEWSGEVEQPITPHDLVTFTYSGNHGYNEPVSNLDANASTNSATLYPNGFAGLATAVPDARFGPVTQIYNSGYSNYDGLTVGERHDLAHGLQGQISYTWSHALQFGTIYNPTNFATATGPTRSESSGSYGATSFDTRHNLEADLVYVEPRLHKRLLNATVGGWTFGSKFYLYSGRPFSVTNSKVASSFGTTTFGGTVLADVLNPSAVGTHCDKAAVRTSCLTASEFATAATTASNGQRDFGNTAPNSFRGPGYFSIASQLSKRIQVTEGAHAEIGADAYNLTNHTNLAVPNSNLGASGFGTITSTVSSPTSIYGTGQGAIVSGRVLVVFGKFIF